MTVDVAHRVSAPSTRHERSVSSADLAAGAILTANAIKTPSSYLVQYQVVTSSTDTFLSFVDWLEDHLDDHEIDGDHVASYNFLSRHHFDRVIRATAGEPPAGLRRRVLLERAAFRLATSRAGILDIAVEAGYSSNEAFTRAFQRAYGRSPSDWRRSPRRFQISAPSDVRFHPPGTLRLPARHEGNHMTSDILLTRMVEHHTWLIGELIDRASRLDDNQLDAPIELSVEGIDDDPTIRRLLSRLVGQMDMWNNVIVGNDYDWSIEESETVTSMRHRSREAGEAFLGEVRRVVEEDRLDDPPVFAHQTSGKRAV